MEGETVEFHFYCVLYPELKPSTGTLLDVTPVCRGRIDPARGRLFG